MSKATVFATMLASMSFAANSNVKKLLKAGKSSDKELAAAATTTKFYKEDLDGFKAKVDGILNAPVAEKAAEPAKTNTGRSGESYKRS
jgi:hypothetical protein